jgi:hypothetical protein
MSIPSGVWHEICTLKLDEDKSKRANLAKQNAFGPALFHCLLRLVKGTATSLAPAKDESNKYDLTAAPSFWWFTISTLPPICSPTFSFF